MLTGKQSQAQEFSAQPLALLVAAFALGILAGQHSEFSLLLLSALALLTTLAAAAALINGRMKIATGSVIVAFLFMGSSLTAIEKTQVPANQLKRLISEGAIAAGEPVELTGVLQREPVIAPDR